MNLFGISRKSLLVLVIGGLVLTPIVACGTAEESSAPAAAPTAAAAQQAAPQQPASGSQQAAAPASPTQAAPAQAAQAAPTAVPQAAGSGDSMMMAEPTGILSTGLKEMGPFFLHPSTLGNPQIFVHGTAPIGEGLLQEDVNREVLGLLAESWEISDDFLVWTFHLNKGVQFHKGYGEMTAEDVVWSMQQWGLSKHPRAGQLETFWADRDGSMIIDSHTLQVHTGEPLGPRDRPALAHDPRRRIHLHRQQEADGRTGRGRGQREYGRHRSVGNRGPPHRRVLEDEGGPRSLAAHPRLR